MNKQHLEAMAQMFYETKPFSTVGDYERLEQWREMVNEFCEVAKKFNPKFDEERFRKACRFS